MKLVLIFFSFFFAQYSLAQKDTLLHKNNVFIELAGTSVFWSINYERNLIHFGDFKFNARAGLSMMNLYDFELKFNPNLTLPTSLQILYGKKQHNLELGTSLIANRISFLDSETLEKETDVKLSGGLILGYRFHKEKSRMNYRVFYSPLWEYFQSYKHWGGLSVGVSF